LEAHYIPCNANGLELDLARTSPLYSLEFAFQLKIKFLFYQIGNDKTIKLARIAIENYYSLKISRLF